MNDNDCKALIWLLLFIPSSTVFLWLTLDLFIGQSVISDTITGVIISLLASVGLILLMDKTVQDRKRVKRELIRNDKTSIIKWVYSKEQWLPFSKAIVKYKVQKIYKAYILAFLGFLLCLYLFYTNCRELTGFFTFLFLLITIPVCVSNIVRFKRVKDIYFDTLNPNVKITTNGFLINNELSQSFDNISKLNKVEVEYFGTIKCVVFEIKVLTGRGGAKYSRHYILYPQCNMVEENEIEKSISYLRYLINNKTVGSI